MGHVTTLTAAQSPKVIDKCEGERYLHPSFTSEYTFLSSWDLTLQISSSLILSSFSPHLNLKWIVLLYFEKSEGNKGQQMNCVVLVWKKWWLWWLGSQASVLIWTYIIPISIIDINHYLMNCVTVFLKVWGQQRTTNELCGSCLKEMMVLNFWWLGLFVLTTMINLCNLSFAWSQVQSEDQMLSNI